MFYERSKSLVGICKDVGTNSSRTLTLDLTQYDKRKQEEEENAAKGESTKRKAKSEGAGAGQLSRKRQAPNSPGTITTQQFSTNGMRRNPMEYYHITYCTASSNIKTTLNGSLGTHWRLGEGTILGLS